LNRHQPKLPHLNVPNPKEFSKYIAAAKPIVEFFLATLAEQERDPHRLVSAAERVVLPLIAAIPSPMEREHFIQIAARVLGLSNEAVRESLQRLQKHTDAPSSSTNVQNVKGAAKRSPRDIRSEQLLSVVHAYQGTPLAIHVKSEYGRIIGDQPFPADPLPESALFEAERMFGEKPDEGAADELLRAFEETVIREAYQEAVAHLRRIERQSASDDSAIKDAQAVCTEISARLAALHLFSKNGNS